MLYFEYDNCLFRDFLLEMEFRESALPNFCYKIIDICVFSLSISCVLFFLGGCWCAVGMVMVVQDICVVSCQQPLSR